MKQIEFKSLTNIETSFRLTRLVMFGVIIVSFLFSIVVAYLSFSNEQKARERVYIMENGKSIMLALAQENNMNRPAEARDHIKTFLKLFFELEPDEAYIKKNIQEASYMGDESIVRLYKDFEEKGYYNNLVQGNVHQKIEIDKNSIQIDMTKSPYYFRAKGKEMLVRESTITVRNLEVDGYLIDVQRTDNNPHGFMIERFHPIDNRDIEVITRDANSNGQ